MAEIQKENGYTAIANDLLEALYRFGLTRNEYKVMLCVIRHTYGYNKKEHPMSLTFIANDTGLVKERVCEALNGLKVKNLLSVTPAKGIQPQILSVQKDTDKWFRVTENVTVTDSVTVTENVINRYGKRNPKGYGKRNQGKTNIKYKEGKTDSGAVEPPTPQTHKPVRHKHGEYKHVLLTDEQYNKLLSDYGADKLAEYIRKVDEYCQQHGKTYADWNLTIRNWMRRDGVDKNDARTETEVNDEWQT